MANQKVQDMRRLLYLEALSLYAKVAKSYRLRGIPVEHWGLPRLLQEIANKLNQNTIDISWLEENSWGIYHIVSDSYLEGTSLGKDLYDFSDRIDKFVAMCKSEGMA